MGDNADTGTLWLLLALSLATWLLARRQQEIAENVKFLMDHAVTAEQEARPT